VITLPLPPRFFGPAEQILLREKSVSLIAKELHIFFDATSDLLRKMTGHQLDAGKCFKDKDKKAVSLMSRGVHLLFGKCQKRCNSIQRGEFFR